MLTETEPADAH